jgi:uncharacterized protein YdaL
MAHTIDDKRAGHRARPPRDRRFSTWRVLAASAAFATIGTWGQPSVIDAAPSPHVLVLYDSGGPWGYLGGEYALMVGNLLGHFDAILTSLPVTQYSSGLMNRYTAAFYIGSTYDEPSFYPAGSAARSNYDAFLADAATTRIPLVWVNHNLWKLAWSWNPSWSPTGFSGKFGIQFVDLESAPYNRVTYKNTDLWKGVVPHVNPGADLTGCTAESQQGSSGMYACSPELNVVAVTDSSKAIVRAEAYSTFTTARGPYITQADNLWVVGDLPLSYVSEEDRYLAFADILHDVLGIAHAESHRAIVRLEDVSAADDTQNLSNDAAVLSGRGVRFSVATIPIYRDPTGIVNGVPTEILLHGSAVGDLLKYWQDRAQADVLQEGTTHQWDGANNPYDRVSGDDFEFYRVIQNADYSLTFAGALPGDSGDWAKSRIMTGQAELKRTGLTSFAWSAPHFVASDTDYRAIAAVYRWHYGRMIYFAPASPAGRFLGQFFPYVIHQDAYGYNILPENIGYIEPNPIPGYQVLLPSDLIEHAAKALVVRDGFASFYFDPSLDPSYLDQTAAGIQALGYTFVGAACLNEPGLARDNCQRTAGQADEQAGQADEQADHRSTGREGNGKKRDRDR